MSYFFMLKMETFELVIPGSTSNIGPGFDTLGIALDIYNRLTVEPSRGSMKIIFEHGVEEPYAKNVLRLVKTTVRAYCEKTSLPVPKAKFAFRNQVPIARGLGSSATFRLGTLTALNKLAQAETGKPPLSSDEILEMACGLEKHTENCVAGMVGGFTASGFVGERVRYCRFEIKEDFTFVTAVPHPPMSTAQTRKLLPRRVPMKDAVANLNRTALLIHALTSGKTENLQEFLDDRFHQPFRVKVITPLYEVIESAREAGALGAFLSGSGSSIIAIAKENFQAIGKAMKEVLDKSGWNCNVFMLKMNKTGMQFAAQ